jgi:uroporphyrinogen decarboxylase
MQDYGELLSGTGANVLGVTWTADLRKVRDSLPENVGVQGNLDPVLMSTTPELVEQEAKRLLEEMRGTKGWIFNLGHGIQPSAKPENMAKLVETVSNWKW